MRDDSVEFAAARRPETDSRSFPLSSILAAEFARPPPLPSLTLLLSDSTEVVFSPVTNGSVAASLIQRLIPLAASSSSNNNGNGNDNDNINNDDDDASVALALQLEEEERRARDRWRMPSPVRSPLLPQRSPRRSPVRRGVEVAPEGFPKTLTVYSSVIADKPELEASDKIMLPPRILEELIAMGANSYPFLFQLEGSIRTTHAGVLSFTAPANTVYMPYWMMASLGIEEGSDLEIDLADLPKGTSVQLQPTDASWLELDPANREAVLLDQLSRHQCLTKGDTITLRSGSREYVFNVIKCAPRSAICIVDTNLATDVIEPLGFSSTTPASASASSSSASASTNPNNPDTSTSNTLTPSTPTISQTVEPNTYTTFSFRVQNPYGFEVTVEPTEPGMGDPDVYISNITPTPQRNHFTWSGVQKDRAHVTVFADDPSFKVGTYYASVTTLGSDPVSFDITFHELTASSSCPPPPSPSSSSSPSTPSTPVVEPGTCLCDHCGQYVRETVFVMHERHCARRNKRCETCGEMMPASSLAKHIALEHELLVCECGVELTQDALAEHRRNDCPYRTVPCWYCPLSMPAHDLESHADACGARTSRCRQCFRQIQRSEMGPHLVLDHGLAPSTTSIRDELIKIATLPTPTGDPNGTNQAFPTSSAPSSTPPPPTPTTPSTSLFECPLCHQALASFDALSAHYIVFHTTE